MGRENLGEREREKERQSYHYEFDLRSNEILIRLTGIRLLSVCVRPVVQFVFEIYFN